MSSEVWQNQKLASITKKIGSGSTPRGGSGAYKEVGLPFIRSQNVYNCVFNPDGLVYIDDEQAKKLANVELEQDDVLLNITGDSVARCTKVPKEYVGGRVNQHVAIIRVDDNILDSNFLKYSLVNSRMQKYLLSLASSGGTRAALTKAMIENIEICLPPLDNQKAIANILSSLDEKIEVTNTINTKLEEMAEAIFKQWFVDFEFPNEEGKPYKSSGGAMVESELGMIPEGWEVKILEDLTSLIIDHRGKTPRKLGGDWSESGFKAISAKNIKSNRIVKPEDIRFLNKKMYEKWMSEPLKAGDILMTSEAPLGELYYLAEKEEYCLSQRLYGLRSNENIMSSALFFMSLNSKQVIENIKNRATGTTVLGIRQSELRKVPLIVAPIEIQMQIAPIIEDMLRKIYLNEKESYTLKKIRDILIPKLMSGEIRVSLEKE